MVEVINHLGSSFFAWLSLHTVVQELGREGILPFSSFFASNRPFNAPLAGLFTEYLVSCIYLFAVPPGDAYIFLINSKSNIFNSDAFQLRFVCQWYLTRWLLLIPWFHLACSCYTCRHIKFGTGILLFELRNLSFLYISFLTFFWWSCHSFHLLQGLTRSFRTGYVTLFYFAYVLFRHDSFTFLSRTQSAVSSSLSLVSHTGIYGVLGFRKEKDIVFSESGLMMKTVSLDTYSGEYLWYHTLLEHRNCMGTHCQTTSSYKTSHPKCHSFSYVVLKIDRFIDQDHVTTSGLQVTNPFVSFV